LWTKMKNFLKRFLPVPAKTHHEQMQMLATHMQHMDDHLKKLYEAMGSVRSRVARIDKSVVDQAVKGRKYTDLFYKDTRDKIEKLQTTSCDKIEKLQTISFENRDISIQRIKRIVWQSAANMFRRRYIEQLDFHVVDHCNLNCKGCNHFSPLVKESFADVKSFESDMKQLSSLVGDTIQKINLIGGEPLLHPEISQFATIAKKFFTNARITLITNGLLVEEMPQKFWETMKAHDVCIKYTRYPINFDYDKMSNVVREKGVRVINDWADIKYFWRIPLNISERVFSYRSYAQCPFIDCTQLRNGRLYRCAQSAYVDFVNNFIRVKDNNGDNFRIDTKDYLDIYSPEGLEEVQEFLSNPIPFCRYCDMDNMDTRVPWEHSGRKIDEWVDAQ